MKRVHDKDPERLELSDPALKRALSSLADEEGPSAAELQRVRQRLMGVFETPPPVRVSPLSFARGPLAALLVGVAIAGVIGWVRYQRDHADTEPRDLETPRGPEPAAPTAPMADLPAPPPAISSAEVVAPARADAAHAPERRVAPRRGRTHGSLSHARSTTRPTASSIEATGTTGDETTDNSPTAGPASPEQPAKTLVTPPKEARASVLSAPSPAHTGAETPRDASPTRPASPGPLDEASLLQRARQLAAADPEASLRLLNEHKQRFGHGMLVPEREVLAIELLRALSRREEAARRLVAFRHDFPDSVYLQRLEQ